MMDRTELIRSRLIAHLRDELRLTVLPLGADAWRRMIFPPQYRFGWFRPIHLGDGALVMFSPELISEVTADLDACTFDAYLTAIEMAIDLHVANRKKPFEEIEQLWADTLYEIAPDALKMCCEVDARAIDQGLVASL